MLLTEDQDFSLSTEKDDLLNKMIVKGSTENETFYQYQIKMGAWQKENEKQQNILKEDKENAEAKASVKKIDEEVREYRATMASDYPNLFLTKILRMMADPDVPEFPRDDSGKVLDSAFQYYWLKNHYWDNTDFSDDRILRTPVYYGRLKRFMEQMTVQVPDSVKNAADRILELTERNKEIFKYTLITIFNMYVNSKIMGMDAVYVHLSQNYYMTKRVDWVDHESKFYKDLIDRIEKLDKTTLGKQMINFMLQTPSGEDVILHSMKADYIVTFFYDPGCGHCRKMLPVMKKNYENFKDYGVKFLGICTIREKDKFTKGVEEHKLDWINLFDEDTRTDFKNWYDIYSTPVLYILDNNKTIIAKRIAPEQVEDFLEHKLGIEIPADRSVNTVPVKEEDDGEEED